MIITRRNVLQAIRTEPLKKGRYIHGRKGVDDNGRTERIYDSECSVCAVGAVLRQAGIPNDEIGYKASCLIDYSTGSSELIKDCLADGDYLSALSSEFERMRKVSSPESRKKLCNWVKKNLPIKFEV